MSLFGLALIVAVVAADSDAPGNDQEKPVGIGMVAVRATNEGRDAVFFEPDIKGIQPAVADLKQFDTYRKVRSENAVTPFAKEAKLAIDSKYTLYITPVSMESGGRIECKVRVTTKTESKDDRTEGESVTEKTALSCNVKATPDKQFKIAGLKLDEGFLVIVLTLKI